MKDRPDRPSPYGLMWRADGKRIRAYFKKAADRDEKMRQLERESKRGRIDLVLARDDARDWLAFKRAVDGTPWQDVVAAWRQVRGGAVESPLTVKQAVDDYLAHLQKLISIGRYKATTFKHKDTQLQRFSDAFGPQRLAILDACSLESWIVDHLGFKVPGTFNSYRRTLVALYNHFKREIPHNAANLIPPRKDTSDMVGILTVAQLAKLMTCAKQRFPAAVGRLALEAFAGLRFSSSVRLEKHEINFADKGIMLPGVKIKTGKRFYVDGFPDNLWDWLAVANDAGWELESSAWMHLKTKVFLVADVPHPHNCMRHSFCTHHIAAFKNPGLTAALLCHRSQELLWKHYNGLASQAAGKAYWTITPESAEAMAKNPDIEKLHYPQLGSPGATGPGTE